MNKLKIGINKKKIPRFLIINPSELTKQRLKSIKKTFHITYLEKGSLEDYKAFNKLVTFDKINTLELSMCVSSIKRALATIASSFEIFIFC